MSEFYYLTDGSAVGNYNGMPYNFHPKATPEQWSWFQAELAAGNFQEVARPPDPAADPIDPAIVENSWRETQMPIAQQNVTAKVDNLRRGLWPNTPNLNPPTTRNAWLGRYVRISILREGSHHEYQDGIRSAGRCLPHNVYQCMVLVHESGNGSLQCSGMELLQGRGYRCCCHHVQQANGDAT